MGARKDPAIEAWELWVELMMRNKSRLARIAQELELTPMQLHALRALQPGAELPMSALAEALVCDASNVTGIVDRLEARGLIERRGASHDRRVRMLAVTRAGARVRALATERLTEPPPELANLSRAEHRQLRDLLRKALQRQREHVPAAAR
jgi:MarR family transcriptional regulator, organic hydroperoxide resistance regulator